MVDYATEQAGARVSAPSLNRSTRPTVARFAVASAVPPHITDAMSVADRLHRTLVSHSATPVFTGCEPDSTTPLTGNDHAYVLPEVDARRSERIRFLTVIANMGFDEDEAEALQRVTRLWGRDGHDLQLVYLGIGSPEDFAWLRA
jgi:CRISPR-associated protein Csb2